MTRHTWIERNTPPWLLAVAIVCAVGGLVWTVADYQAAFLARAEGELLP